MLIQASPTLAFQIASDLHLPQWASVGRLPPFHPDPEADLLILAGDLSNGPPTAEGLRWLRALPDGHWPMGILMVLGNHDYYGMSLDDAAARWRVALRDTRIRVLDREVATAGGCRIAGCTLWTDYDGANPISMLLAERSLADHAFIHAKAGSARAEDMLAAHRADRAFLMNQTPGTPESPLIVVTHHAPSWRSVSPAYQGSLLNPAFVSDLESEMAALSPSVWVHGHVHSFHDYRVGDTRVVCHPLGYPGELDHVD